MERRILGSIYGSTKPERDFSHALDLYRDGRLPLLLTKTDVDGGVDETNYEGWLAERGETA